VVVPLKVRAKAGSIVSVRFSVYTAALALNVDLDLSQVNSVTFGADC